MDLPKRKPNRLFNYDYSQNGAYFITICTHNKQNILSKSNRRGGVLLLPKGIICDDQIRELEKRYPIEIDKYVIMPNHVHLIVAVKREEQSPSPTISDVICAFKSITTKMMNTNDGTKGRIIWQRSYHDHIIRGERDYEEIWQYIDTNPQKWADDCFYTDNNKPDLENI